LTKRAYIFDFDGTLVDSEPLWAEALDRALREQGIELVRREIETLVYGRSRVNIIQDLVRDYPQLGDILDHLQERIDQHLDELHKNADIRIHSSIDLLRRLSSNWPVAIVSGSDRRFLGEWVGKLDLESHLEFFLGCEDYPVGKPDPTCFLMAAERLGADPADCIVFEDSRAGVRAAKAAGMTCIALALPGKSWQDISAADRVLNDLAHYDDGEVNP